MRYVISISDENDSKFYFAGWDGSDTEPSAGEITYWRPLITDPETYEYEDFWEVECEVKLLTSMCIGFAIGLPEEFGMDSIRLKAEEVRIGSYGR